MVTLTTIDWVLRPIIKVWTGDGRPIDGVIWAALPQMAPALGQYGRLEIKPATVCQSEVVGGHVGRALQAPELSTDSGR